MRNIVIVIIVVLIAWVAYTNYMPKEKPKNVVTDYAANLKTSGDKALEAKGTVNLAMLRSAITQFHGSQGRYPDSLQELVAKGFLDRIPAGDYKYDRNTGELK
jgi:hypothetical protein